MYVSQLASILHKLDVARLEARLHHVVRQHAQVQVIRLPHTVHQLEKLKYKVILAKVIAALQHEVYALRVSLETELFLFLLLSHSSWLWITAEKLLLVISLFRIDCGFTRLFASNLSHYHEGFLFRAKHFALASRKALKRKLRRKRYQEQFSFPVDGEAAKPERLMTALLREQRFNVNLNELRDLVHVEGVRRVPFGAARFSSSLFVARRNRLPAWRPRHGDELPGDISWREQLADTLLSRAVIRLLLFHFLLHRRVQNHA